ncbi:MAG: RNA methyltransferase [Bacteroidota bacterium]
MDFSELSIEQLNSYRDFLLELLTPRRKELLLEKIAHRTRYLSVVVENIFQPHNTSAVIRSCDCFGVQDLHVIENKNTYKVNPDIVLGANRWINISQYPNAEDTTRQCILGLKNKGYKIVATTPHLDSFTPETLPVDHKIALVFGAEVEGISRDVSELADYSLRIPMVGFTESLNISVSAAICLYSMSQRIRNDEINWRLDAREQAEVLIKWAKINLRRPEIIENAYFSDRNKA